MVKTPEISPSNKEAFDRKFPTKIVNPRVKRRAVLRKLPLPLTALAVAGGAVWLYQSRKAETTDSHQEISDTAKQKLVESIRPLPESPEKRMMMRYGGPMLTIAAPTTFGDREDLSLRIWRSDVFEIEVSDSAPSHIFALRPETNDSRILQSRWTFTQDQNVPFPLVGFVQGLVQGNPKPMTDALTKKQVVLSTRAFSSGQTFIEGIWPLLQVFRQSPSLLDREDQALILNFRYIQGVALMSLIALWFAETTRVMKSLGVDPYASVRDSANHQRKAEIVSANLSGIWKEITTVPLVLGNAAFSVALRALQLQGKQLDVLRRSIHPTLLPAFEIAQTESFGQEPRDIFYNSTDLAIALLVQSLEKTRS